MSAHTYAVIRLWCGIMTRALLQIQYYSKGTLLWFGHLAAECGVTLP